MTDTVRIVLYCPHCGNRAPQRLIHTQIYMEKAWSLHDGSEDAHPWSTFVAVCETCDQVLLYDNPLNHFEDKEFHSGGLTYPKSGFLHSSVPKNIADVYEEAFRIKAIAPNAYAVQIRRALEAICEDRGATKGNLQSKLSQLTDNGDIPPVLSDVSDVLRLLGNIGAHGLNESVHPLQAFVLDYFFRAIVEYVYIAPSKLKEFKDRMDRYREKKDDSED